MKGIPYVSLRQALAEDRGGQAVLHTVDRVKAGKHAQKLRAVYILVKFFEALCK